MYKEIYLKSRLMCNTCEIKCHWFKCLGLQNLYRILVRLLYMSETKACSVKVF